MGAMSISHWLVVLLVVVVLFGRGKVASLMGELGQGIKDFKRGMAAPDEPASAPVPVTAQVEPARTEAP